MTEFSRVEKKALRELAGHFGRTTAKHGDKLAGYATNPGSTGAPPCSIPANQSRQGGST